MTKQACLESDGYKEIKVRRKSSRRKKHIIYYMDTGLLEWKNINGKGTPRRQRTNPMKNQI